MNIPVRTAAAQLAKAGSLLLISRGDWSAYQVTGFFVALADFDPMEHLRTFLQQRAAAGPRDDDDAESDYDPDAFLAHLIRAGLLLEIEHDTLHLGHAINDPSTVTFFTHTSIKEPTA